MENNTPTTPETDTPAVPETDTPAVSESNDGVMAKLKKIFGKILGGVKSFFIKAARTNSKNCYGSIAGIGNLLVYEDHALISALGMEDITFTRDNVKSYAFAGLGNFIGHSPTAKYIINVDDRIPFPDAVRERQNVSSLTAFVYLYMEKDHYVGNAELGFDDCDIYDYTNSFIYVLNLKKFVNGKEEHYKESYYYSYDLIEDVIVQDTTYVIKIKDKTPTYLHFTPKSTSTKVFFETLKRRFEKD